MKVSYLLIHKIILRVFFFPISISRFLGYEFYNYLNSSLCQIPALSDCSQDELDETVAVIPNSEATSPAGEDFTVTIDPSHHSLDQQQDADAPKVLPRGNELFSRGSSEKICCILLVAVAILLVNWM